MNLLFIFSLLFVGCATTYTDRPDVRLYSEDAKSLQPKYEKKAKEYVIATQGPYSTEAGKKMFQLGGNIVDAFAAISFVISVERPQSTGIGGGGFLLLYVKGMDTPIAIDFREKAPLKGHSKMFLDSEGNEISGKSLTGMFSVGVPGLVAGVLEVHQKYGKLPLSKVMSPAITLARNGFPVYPELAFAINYKKESLKKFRDSRKIFLNEKSEPLKEGDLLVQSDLAKTLERIAENGRKGFYQGAVADSIIKESKRSGEGYITQKDMDQYNVKYRKPVSGTYKGYKVYSMSPPSSGGIHVIQMLNILENDSLKKNGAHHKDSIHLVSSSMQAAFADRAAYLGDSDFVKVPISGLTSKKYAKKIRNSFKNNYAMKRKDRKAGNPFKYEKDQTTHFSIMDKEGNVAVSTQTINGYFGSSVVAPGTGVVLNNEMDDFATKVGASNLFGAIGGKNNLVEAEKRPLSSMSPTIVFDNVQKNMPKLALGTPSGTRIITCVMQTILNYIEYDLPLFESVAALRYHHQWAPDEIRVESRGFDQKTSSDLLDFGHKINKKNLGCRIQAIAKEKDILIGVSDPRGEGKSDGI